MTDLQKRIEELEKIKFLENPYDWEQAKNFNKSQEEWFYHIQQCMATEALSIISQLEHQLQHYKNCYIGFEAIIAEQEDEIKQLKGENNDK